MSLQRVTLFFKRRFRHSARVKILAVLLALNLLFMLLFTSLVQRVMSDELRHDADNRLRTAAEILPLLLPADFLPHTFAAIPPSLPEYLSHAAVLEHYCQIAGLRSLEAFRLINGKVTYLLASASPAQIHSGRFGRFLAPVQNATLAAALKEGTPRYATLQDSRGEAFSYIYPVRLADGSQAAFVASIDQQQLLAGLSRIGWRTGWAGALLFLLTSLVCVVVVHHFSAPLTTFARAVRRMTSGDFGVRVQTGRQDELGSLAHAFNALGEMISSRDRELRELAFVDSLTSLANRVGFLHFISGRLPQESGECAVVILNLNDFHYINEHLGYQDGDAALRSLAERLNRFHRPVTQVARLGGNTFALFLERIVRQDVADLMERIDSLWVEPLYINGQRLDISATTGVAIYPEHGQSADILLRNAELAQYEAKRARRNFAIYDPVQEAFSRDQLTLMGDLREALAEGHLRVYYQPKVKMSDGTVAEAEALVRWQHPERGFISPGVFIPFAEQTGKLRAITEWVVHDVLKQSAQWSQQGLDLCISVNVGISDVEDILFVSFLEKELTLCQVLPHRLCLEITETGVMRNPKELMRNLEYLRLMGVKLSIDDFGTGYSSFAYLAKMPVHELKIDQSFVISMNERFENVSIVRSIIELGHILGLSVIAEGVETESVWQALAVMGCDEAQGYLIAAPMPAADFLLWCQSGPKDFLPAPLPSMGEEGYGLRHCS